jgi:hypothetical protein
LALPSAGQAIVFRSGPICRISPEAHSDRPNPRRSRQVAGLRRARPGCRGTVLPSRPVGATHRLPAGPGRIESLAKPALASEPTIARRIQPAGDRPPERPRRVRPTDPAPIASPRAWRVPG